MSVSESLSPSLTHPRVHSRSPSLSLSLSLPPPLSLSLSTRDGRARLVLPGWGLCVGVPRNREIPGRVSYGEPGVGGVVGEGGGVKRERGREGEGEAPWPHKQLLRQGGGRPDVGYVGGYDARQRTDRKLEGHRCWRYDPPHTLAGGGGARRSAPPGGGSALRASLGAPRLGVDALAALRAREERSSSSRSGGPRPPRRGGRPPSKRGVGGGVSA